MLPFKIHHFDQNLQRHVCMPKCIAYNVDYKNSINKINQSFWGFATQAHWKNIHVVIFLQNYIMLLRACFQAPCTR